MRVKKLAEGTYYMGEFGKFGFVRMYLLIGEEKTLLIDSGYGKIDLKKIVSRLTNKPVILVLTHGHIDHISGSSAFPAYLFPLDFEVYQKHSDPEFIRPFLKETKASKNVLPLDQEELDLGGRKVRILPTPGHTPGSVCLLDPFSKMAFCGDTINPWDVWLGLEESSSVAEYENSLKALQNAIKESSIAFLHSGHNFRPMKPELVDDFITLCERIQKGECKGKKVSKGICRGQKSAYKKARLIWRKAK